MIAATEIVASLGPQLRERRPGRVARFRRPAIDSRQAGAGDFFIARPGEGRDGHEFVCDAVGRGVRGVLVRRAPEALPAEVAVFVVPDTLAALQRLAAGRRDRRHGMVIGLTGSLGKATTKEFAAALLAARYPVLKNEANCNNEIGLPLTLLELTHRHRRAVLGDMGELGAAEREGHLAAGRRAAETADIIHTVGELGSIIAGAAREAGHNATHHWPTKEAAAEAVAADLRLDDVVPLRASRAMALETLLDVLRE